jgi:hypothetical protein
MTASAKRYTAIDEILQHFALPILLARTRLGHWLMAHDRAVRRVAVNVMVR